MPTPSLQDLENYKKVERQSTFDLARAYGKVPPKSRPKRKIAKLQGADADGNEEISSGSVPESLVDDNLSADAALLGVLVKLEPEDAPRPKSTCVTILSGEVTLQSRPFAGMSMPPLVSLNDPGAAFNSLEPAEPVEVAETVTG